MSAARARTATPPERNAPILNAMSRSSPSRVHAPRSIRAAAFKWNVYSIFEAVKRRIGRSVPESRRVAVSPETVRTWTKRCKAPQVC